jgi:hypothetical protein
MPPMPKDPETRQRRNRASTAGVIEAAPATMPALGTRRPDSTREKPVPWHSETRRWWRTIWASAVAERWVDVHVPGLRALARLVDDYWRATSPGDARALHAEIRMMGREFGLTPMAGRSMGWEFRRRQSDEQPKGAAPLPPGADPRKVLSLEGRRRA